MTSVAVAISPTGGTGFGSSGASSVFSMIVTGASPLLVTFHDTVVSPVAGSHSAFAAYTTDGALAPALRSPSSRRPKSSALPSSAIRLSLKERSAAAS